jgi:thiol:disulfide interchange protein DsbC
MRKIFVMAVVVMTLFACASYAASRSGVQKGTQQKIARDSDLNAIHNCASCHSLSKEEAGALFKGLGEVTDVKTSPLKGLYEITVRQKNRQAVAYLDFGKKLLVPGPLFDIATKRPITPPPVELPKVISKAELDKIPLTNSIVMGNPVGKKRMFVFTDPDCPFCGKLHGELKKLVAMEPDLAVYIKMYPLKSHPTAYDKARVILGAKSLELLEKAFSGEKLPAPGDRDPGLPVDESIKLGDSLGVEGTPAMIFPGGSFVAGFRDAKNLRALLLEEKTGK